MTVADCTINENVGGASGGALYNSGNLTGNNLIMKDNKSANYGGAVYNTGTATLRNITVTGNSTTETGGAIYNHDVMYLSDATMKDNTAENYDYELVSRRTDGKFSELYLSGKVSAATMLAGATSAKVTLTGIVTNENPIGVSLSTVDTSSYYFHGLQVFYGDPEVISASADAFVLNEKTGEKFALAGDGKLVGLTDEAQSTVQETGIVHLKDSDGKVKATGTLSAMVAAAYSGDTLVIASDLTQSTPVIISKSLNIIDDGAIRVIRSPSTHLNPIVIQGNKDEDNIHVNITTTDTGGLVFDGKTPEGESVVMQRAFIAALYADVKIQGNIVMRNINNHGVQAEGAQNATNNHGGALRVSSTAKVELVGVTFENCYAVTYGGAVYNAGKLTLESVTAKNCSSGREGGAICNMAGGEVTLRDSILTGSQAGASGGAIYNAGKMDIIDTTITGNSSQASGGAIFGSAKGEMTITGSTITGNSAVGYGGGIYSSNALKIHNCILKDNLTNRTGHNIFNAKTGLVDITDSDISGGIVIDGTGGSSGGGSTSNGSGTAQLWVNYGTPEQRRKSSGTLFDVAKKAGEGDTVVITSDAYLGSTAWKIYHGNSFTITDDGKGPYTVTSGAPDEYMVTFQGINGSYTNPDGTVKTVLTIKGTAPGSIIFDGQDAERSRAAVNLFYGGMHLENVAFRNFKSSASGGAVYIQRSAAATMKNVTIENCAVARSGAGVYVQGQLTAEDCAFSNNTATNYGAGIYAEHNELSPGRYTGVTLINCTVENNVVEAMYGAGICTTARLAVSGGNIIGNKVLSTNGAGGVYVGSQPASFTNVTFTGNTANTSGAGIFANGSLTLDHVTITDNSAPSNGGVNANGAVTIISSTIRDNNREAHLAKNDLRMGGATGQLVLKGTGNDFGTLECQNDGALTVDPTFALKDGASVILQRATYNVGDAAIIGDAAAVSALSAHTTLDATGRILKADGTIGKVFAVTLSDGVAGATSSDGTTDYTFSIDGYDTTKYTYTVTVRVGGTVISVTDNGDGNYTIPHSLIIDDVFVAVKKRDLQGPTFEDDDGTTLEPGQPGYNEVEAYVDVNEDNVTNYGTLAEVAARAVAGDTVTVRRNVTLTTQLVLNKDLTIGSDGTDWTVDVAYTATGNHPIDIQGADESNKITVNISDLIIDGRNISRDKALVRTRYATLNLKCGTVVQNTVNTTSGLANGGAACRIETDSLVNLTEGTLIQDNKGRFGAAFYINGGKLMIYDAAIGANGHGNEATSNAVIYLAYGTVELFDSASVCYNTSASSGGAFYNTGIVRVHDGARITHNTVTASNRFGAAAWVDSKGQFIVSSGATVNDNSSQGGGAFYMTGGTLNVAGTMRNNTSATASGSAIILNSGSDKTVTVNIQNGAIIKDNTSTAPGGSDISVLSGTLNITGTVDVGSIALNEDETITPAGAVTLTPGAERITVKPTSYSVGTQILSGDSTALAYQAFCLENEGYYIDSDGRIISEEREALSQIAYAFYDKDQAGYIHYDMSGMAKAGYRLPGSPLPATSRRQLYVSPEDAAAYRKIYMDCSGFIWNLYYSAFGDAFKAVIPESKASANGIGNAYDTDDYLIYSWGSTSGTVTIDDNAKNEVIEWLDGNLQVGDVISLYRADGATGHVVMYIGNGKVIDSGGYSYKYHDAEDDTSMGEEDNAKADEGIRIATAAERITVGKDVGVRVVRPLGKLTSAALTENAQARAALGRLAVSKTVLPIGNAMASGGTLTYTITLHNTGSLPVTVDVTDTTPLGTTVADPLVWNDVIIAPGATETLSYNAMVTAAKGQIVAGRCTVSRNGATAALEVPCNAVYVGAALEADDITAMRTALTTPPTGDAVTYLKELYQNTISRDIPLTGDDELFAAVFEEHTAAAAPGWYLVRESVTGDLGKCLVANFQAGHMVANRDNDELHGRIRYLAKDNLMPGDVVAVDLKNDAGYAYYIWLGDDMKVVTDSAVTDGDADLLMEQLLGHDRFLVLRFSRLPASIPVTLNDGISGAVYAVTGSNYQFSFTGTAGIWYAVVAEVDAGATTRTLYNGAGPHTGTVIVPNGAKSLTIGMTQLADAEAIIDTTFYPTLDEAMSAADTATVPTTVEVLSDCAIITDVEYTNAIGITILPFGADRTITLGAIARITVSGDVTYLGSDSAGLTITGLDAPRTVSGAFAVTGSLNFGDNVTVTGMNNQYASHDANTNNGAVANVQAAGAVQIDGASIIGNRDKAFGAAFFAKEGVVNMTAGEISNNTAGNHGGAIYLMGSGAKFTMTGGEMKNNTSTGNGGAIYAASDTTVSLSGGAICDNTAVKGGAVYVEAASGRTVALTIGAATVANNTATTADITGGVHAGANSILRIQSGAVIIGNKAATFDRDVYTPSTVAVQLEGELNIGYIYRYVSTIGKVMLTGEVALKDGCDPIIVVSKKPAVGLVALDGNADIIAQSYGAFAIDSDDYVVDADGKLAAVDTSDMKMSSEPAGLDVDLTKPTDPVDLDALPSKSKEDDSEDDSGDDEGEDDDKYDASEDGDGEDEEVEGSDGEEAVEPKI